MSWHSVTMSVDDVVNRKHIKLQDEFTELFTVLGGPAELAMFSESFIDREDENSVYFFSPASLEKIPLFLEKWGSEPCARPEGKVALLVGHADAKETLLGT